MKTKLKNLILFFPFLLFAGAFSCASIEVKQDFDFSVEHLPYRQTLADGTSIDIRFEIRPGEEGFLSDSTRFFVRYFPTAGQGTLRVEQDTALVPNDLYRLMERSFRMYYTPRWGTANVPHTLDLTFLDNWGHTHAVTLTFNRQEAIENDFDL